jgi:hypothetical protein
MIIQGTRLCDQPRQVRGNRTLRVRSVPLGQHLVVNLFHERVTWRKNDSVDHIRHVLVQ